MSESTIDKILTSAVAGLLMSLADFAWANGVLFGILQFADLIIGGAAAWLVFNDVSATKFFKGLVKKGLAWIMLGVLIAAEPFIASHGVDLDIATWFLDGLIAYELYSICENYLKMDAPGAAMIKDLLAKLQQAFQQRVLGK